jgi:polysaccharide pyruvyl transferase CsaB
MTESNRSNLLIAGYYGFGNTGDETILAAMLADLRKHRENLEVTVISGNPQETETNHQVRSILWTDTQSIIEAVQKSDMVILGGGGIFHDQFGFEEEYLLTRNHSGVSFFSGFALLAAMYQKPLMLYAVGVGPLLTEAGERLTKVSFEAANVASVRDAESLGVLHKLGLQNANVFVTGDPAFMLKPDEARAKKILQNLNLPRNGNAPMIAVCVRYWDIQVSPEKWESSLAGALDRFVEEVNGEILFIPFQNLETTPDVNDVAVALAVREQMRNKSRSTILNKEYPPETIAGLIVCCDFVVGMRYHSLIFSIMSRKPLVGLAYDPKVEHLLTQAGMTEYLFNLDTMTPEGLHEGMQRAWRSKEEIRERLRESIKYLDDQARRNTTFVLDLLDRRTPAQRGNIDHDFIWDLAKNQTYSLAKHEKTVQVLNEQNRELTLQVEELTSLPLVSLLWKSRLRWMPPGSKRDRAFKFIRREGFQAFVQRLYERGIETIRKRRGGPARLAAKPTITASSGKLDVFCFPVIDWDFRFQRPQQLLTQFAKNGHRVFYIRTQFKGLMDHTLDIRQISDRIYEITLPGESSISMYRDDLTGETLRRSFLALHRFMKDEILLNSICLVDHPFWTQLAGQLKEQFGWKVVYDCMDDHGGFEISHPEIASRESSLISISDLVFVTSQVLLSRLSKTHQNCVLIPNAGDFAHFSQLPPGKTGPLAKLPRPIIGYYGAIGEWFDTDAIERAAAEHPGWSFALIGNTTNVDLRNLNKLRNVHFLGEQPYKDLPAYLADIDVCTIPFRRIPLTEATNPVKVFEYLSAGKPVVATALPELEPYQDLLYLYSDAEEFTTLLERAVREDNDEIREKRVALARRNTWEIRYQAAEKSIVSLYGKVSIIIVTWNNLDYTRQCISSLLADQTWPNYELIVVDNASTDGTVQYLNQLSEEHANIRTILNRSNVGFAAANNIGLNHVQDSEYVVLLNNDTVVPIGWLARLLRHLRDPSVGMVGPVTNSAGNEAKIEVPYTSIEEMNDFAQVYMAARDGEFFEINMLAMYCMAMRREVMESIGPLDESFGIGMFEDDDYARRVREKGYRIVCAEDTFVHHWGRASFSKLESTEYMRLFEKNRTLFEKKWNVKWSPHKLAKSQKITL